MSPLIELTTEQIVSNLRHMPAVDIEATDHEGGTWQLSLRAAEPDTDDEDAIEYTDPDGNEDEVETGAFISLHNHYLWTIEAIK